MKDIIDRFLKNTGDLPDRQRMLANIAYSSDMVKKHFEAILDKYLLTPSQYNLLRILQRMHPQTCRVRELKNMIIDKNSDVSRMIQRLDRSGFITASVQKVDRRATEVAITQKGLLILDEIVKKETANMFDPFLCLNQKDSQQLNALLEKLLKGMKSINLSD